MKASDEIKERVDRFVRDILNLVQRVQEEHRATARRTVTTMLADLERRAADTPPERRPKRRPKRLNRPAPTPKSAAGPVRSGKHRAPSGASSSSATTAPATRRMVAPASGADRATAGTMTATGASTSAREAVVLDTVRSLVRGTAAEISARSGLPNGSVYVALRALVARGRVARSETARGLEYSLVSSGEIHPFKRVRAASTWEDPSAQGSLGEATAEDGSP